VEVSGRDRHLTTQNVVTNFHPGLVFAANGFLMTLHSIGERLDATTFSMMTFSIKFVSATLSVNDTRHK
jgi:hypothetical protein